MITATFSHRHCRTDYWLVRTDSLRAQRLIARMGQFARYSHRFQGYVMPKALAENLLTTIHFLDHDSWTDRWIDTAVPTAAARI